MEAKTQHVLLSTAEKEAVGEVLRQNLELEEKVERLEASNKWLRKQLSAAMLRIGIMEQGEGL